MNLTCYSAERISGKLLVEHAITAIEKGLAPKDMPMTGLNRVSVYLSAEALAKLTEPMRRYDLSAREAIERLAYASMSQRRTQTTKKNATEEDRLRSEMVAKVTQGIREGVFVLAEGSTGLGKSRVLAQSAKVCLEDPKARVCVAAPTLVVLLHLLSESRHVPGLPAPGIRMGRQQFISRRRLARALDEMANDGGDVAELQQRVNAWLAAGAPPQTEHTSALNEWVPGINHLVDDLIHIAPEMADIDCALLSKRSIKDDDATPEPAEEVLDQMAEAASSTRLVFCTHAMVAITVKATPHDADLPWTHLLVDEAHDLESVFANLYSSSLSLLSLRAWLRQSELSRKNEAVEAVSSLIAVLRVDSINEGFRQPRVVTEAIHEHLRPVREIISRARRIDSAEKQAFSDGIGAILSSADHWVGLSHSPVKRYPTIMAGPPSVRGAMESLWNRLTAGVLVSGTIFLPNFAGGLSSAYMSMKLALPKERTRPVGPMTVSWVTSTPKLFVPSSDAAAQLCYPKNTATEEEATEGEDPASLGLGTFADWADAVGAAIAQASERAKGGTLVLTPAFRDVRELRSRLSLVMGPRLLAQERGQTVQAQRGRFIELANRGGRPVWLATGAAWTGLDLAARVDRPEEDNLLTTLIIVRVPFGLNRTSTHAGRKERMGFSVELSETSIRLRQGLGRLIRRAGLRDREIWFLDGRLFASGQFKVIKSLRPILDPYVKELFHLPTLHRVSQLDGKS